MTFFGNHLQLELHPQDPQVRAPWGVHGNQPNQGKSHRNSLDIEFECWPMNVGPAIPLKTGKITPSFCWQEETRASLMTVLLSAWRIRSVLGKRNLEILKSSYWVYLMVVLFMTRLHVEPWWTKWHVPTDVLRLQEDFSLEEQLVSLDAGCSTGFSGVKPPVDDLSWRGPPCSKHAHPLLVMGAYT